MWAWSATAMACLASLKATWGGGLEAQAASSSTPPRPTRLVVGPCRRLAALR